MNDFSLDLQFVQVYKDHLEDDSAICETDYIHFLMLNGFGARFIEVDRFRAVRLIGMHPVLESW